MYRSQNVRFCGEISAGSDAEHPPGAAVAGIVRRNLLQRGWKVSEMDNWRDCGWLFVCQMNEARLEVLLVSMAIPHSWYLVISPEYTPRLMGWILGRKPSAMPSDIYALARDVHQILFQVREFGNIQWCWDDIPNDNNSSDEPLEPLTAQEE